MYNQSKTFECEIVITHCFRPVPSFIRNIFTSKLFYVLNIFYECLLFLENFRIVTSVWSDYFWISYCPFVFPYKVAILHLKWEFPRNDGMLTILQYEDSHIATALRLHYYWRSNSPVLPKMSIKKFVHAVLSL